MSTTNFSMSAGVSCQAACSIGASFRARMKIRTAWWPSYLPDVCSVSRQRDVAARLLPCLRVRHVQYLGYPKGCNIFLFKSLRATEIGLEMKTRACSGTRSGNVQESGAPASASGLETRHDSTLQPNNPRIQALTKINLHLLRP